MEATYNPQTQLFQVAEIKVSYSPTLPPFDIPKIISSQLLYDVFLSFWEYGTICYEEQFCVAYLNRGHQLLGIHQHAKGGISGTFVDMKQILAIGLKANASSCIICHNHPGGQIRPSEHDINLTKKIKKGANVLDLYLLDHIIITKSNYYSFADEGML